VGQDHYLGDEVEQGGLASRVDAAEQRDGLRMISVSQSIAHRLRVVQKEMAALIEGEAGLRRKLGKGQIFLNNKAAQSVSEIKIHKGMDLVRCRLLLILEKPGQLPSGFQASLLPAASYILLKRMQCLPVYLQGINGFSGEDLLQPCRF